MTSEDLLPLILLDLKALVVGDAEKPKWRGALAPLLLVNESFFHSAANLLWNTTDSLVHVFKLLPWFKTEYKGIGMHDYRGSEDWERFSCYASRIQHFHLKYQPDIVASTPAFMELFTLPERPDPFFPSLTSVTLEPEAIHGIPSLFLLTGPPLRSLEVKATMSPNDYQRPSSRAPAENVIHVLPRLRFSAPHLRSFTYGGPVSDKFFFQVSKLTALVSLCLTITTAAYIGSFWEFRPLKFLRNIKLTTPFLTGVFLDVGVVKKPLPPPIRGRSLDTAHVTANQHSQCLMAGTLPSSKIRNMTLKFIHVTDVMPLHLCIALYLQANPAMETVAVECIGDSSQGEDLNDTRYEWPSSTEASDLLLSALKGAGGLRQFHILDVPLQVATFTCSVLQKAIARWTSLTSLQFHIKLEDSQAPVTPSLSFPGLSFLASAIWMHCKSLEYLDFHFDANRIAEEHLIAKAHETTGSATSPLHHGLRHLTINTGNTLKDSTKLELPLSRKAVIARFLDRLFPNLFVVRGSAEGVWEEVDFLVKSYQELRAEIVGEVEGLLKGPRSA